MKINLFFKNIFYLFKLNLKEFLEGSKNGGFVSHQQLNLIIENLKYELYEEMQLLKMPKIKSVDETLDDLIEKKASICRFGDGELNLIEEKDIIFQKASPQIAARLKEILSSNNPGIFIAFPKVIYSSKENINDLGKKFWRTHGAEFREKIENYINFEQQYFSAEISIAYSLYKNYDFDSYFEKIKKIWESKNVSIICGKTIFDNIENNIFETANSVEYIYAPSKNAFEQYNEILAEVQKIDKNRIVIIILGPTAKILAYDLALQGYQALDLGHIAKSYDWYIKNKTTSNLKDAIDFFNPD